ncbi:MAG: serine/threonine-protein kinase, partial [Terracidiphilus sp.]
MNVPTGENGLETNPMRQCDTCGCPLEDAQPYRVCPKCLFSEVLGAESPLPSLEQQAVEAELPQPDAAHNLFPRRDFFRKYDIIERIGGGGQGDVWKVWDFEFCRTLAMKRLSEKALASEPALYRFLAEAQIASQLEHPGILPIFDVGLDPDGRPFYTTQLLPGTTLGDIWRKVHEAAEPDWTVARALGLLVRVCEIMAHAHSRGVIHRDLKPANVLIGPFGDVRVIDWGSAHVLDSARGDFEESFVRFNQPVIQTDRGEALWAPVSPLSTARSGQPVTILFVPPEILDGQSSQVDPQTDVYSVGVMLYGLLAGRFPYSHSDGALPEPRQLGDLVLSGSPAPLRRLNRAISRDLDAICVKAMSRSKAGRYGTMLELADDIRAALELRPVKARRPGPVLRAKRFAQRHAGYVLLACVIVAGLAAGFALTGRLERQRDVALQVQALRNGELAARNGRWREALRNWDEAEADGYDDAISLGLQRAEAWTVLNETDRAAAELSKLMRRSDLGGRRGDVLLRMGEHELFDKSTADQGAEHIRRALTTELSAADRCVAQGLLADSATNALALLQEALRLDPYSHAAHRHSMGLEFLLGRHAELATHIHIFEILYPDDPSPHYLEAAEFALNGRLQQANDSLEPVRKSVDPAMWNRQVSSLQLMAEAAQYYNVDDLLNGGTFDSEKLSQLMAAADCALGANVSGGTNGAAPSREPHLPCVEHGILDGVAAVQALSVPFLKDITPAIQKIKVSWDVYPEALVPFRAATVLETRQPRAGPKSIPLLAIEAELFQMAAD